jgi:filamentous hemagglutinin family protein
MIQSWKLGLASWLVVGSAIVSANCAYAQITPDATLPNNSRVTTQDNIRTIEGGTQAGGNLFHSFGEFSVPTASEAYFNNAADIQNIISRVTGGSVSNIDGLIRANGTANLFLINPNGIVFGANARLNIGGSFVASTANALQFGNIGFFSATDQNIPSPLLTINPSALLFNQINQNAAIQNQSVALAGKDLGGFDAFGLRVPNGKSLLLVGGNVSMDRGQLNANGGRVELGGLGEPGSVGLGVDGDNLSLIFPENVARASVSLTNKAGIYVSGAGGGNIAVNARNLEILGGTVLTAGIGQGLGTAETVAGDITLNATGEIKVAGTGSNVRNLVRLGSQGNGGNITIDSGSFSLGDGAQLTAATRGQGNAGNVTVRAKDAVELANGDILSTVEAGGIGKGGNIDINAATLSLTDGANLLTQTGSASNTQPAGRGDAGNVNLNVTGAIDIVGRRGTSSPGGIFSRAQTGTVGNGGNITIDSGSFSLGDGAQLTAATRGQGNAGNVTVRAKDAVELVGEQTNISSTVDAGGVGKGGNIDINAATLSLADGAQLLTRTSDASKTQPAGRGDAGNVNLNITGAIDIAGKRDTNPSGIFSRVESGTVGNGGNITIDSGSFSLRDRAQLSASTSGQGNAGTIKVNAADFVNISGKSSNSNSDLFVNFQSTTGTAGDIIITSARVTLDNGGRLNAESTSGNGGDINLQTDLLRLRRGAQISTTAGTAEAGGNGGNINIDASQGFIVAVPRQNSDITANAVSGSGGRVTIKAAGIFGIAPLSRQELETLRPDDLDPSQLPTNDITAISQTNPSLSGQITLDILNVDPNSGLINLPVVPVDTSVAQTCTPGSSQSNSEFVVTGRGGLPPSPDETLSSDAVQVDWVTLNPKVENHNQGGSTNISTPEPNSMVEATGWTIANNGDVILTASATTALPGNSRQTPAKCLAK